MYLSWTDIGKNEKIIRESPSLKIFDIELLSKQMEWPWEFIFFSVS